MEVIIIFIRVGRLYLLTLISEILSVFAVEVEILQFLVFFISCQNFCNKLVYFFFSLYINVPRVVVAALKMEGYNCFFFFSFFVFLYGLRCCNHLLGRRTKGFKRNQPFSVWWGPIQQMLGVMSFHFAGHVFHRVQSFEFVCHQKKKKMY